MKKYVVFLCVLLFLSAGIASAEDRIRVAGSGGMIPLITELAKAYMNEKKSVKVEVNQKSIQSAGGIMGAARGDLEIGMANRPLKDDENSLGLYSVEIARVGVVIAANKSVSVREMTSENLCKIYEGKIADWKDLGGAPGKIIALTKTEKDATKETIRKSIACFKDLKEPEGAVIMIPTSPETAKVLANRPFTIGFADMVTVDDAQGVVNALKLDGVMPTADNVKSGKYKLVQTYRLITKGQPSGAAKDFIDFVRGPKGVKIIEAHKAVAVK